MSKPRRIGTYLVYVDDVLQREYPRHEQAWAKFERLVKTTPPTMVVTIRLRMDGATKMIISERGQKGV